MNTNTKIALLALSTTCLVPLSAFAQDSFDIDAAPAEKPLPTYTSYVEGGLGYVDNDARRFGRFTGLDDDGLYLVANVSVLRRAAYTETDPSYFKIEGRNLGIESRSGRVEYGRQGSYRAYLSYDQVPNNLQNGFTPFNGAGTGVLSLPAGWVAGQTLTTPGFAGTVSSNLKEVEIGTERKRYAGGFGWNFMPGWSLKTNVQRETKEGNKVIGFLFYSSGGTRRTANVPEPVDYVTDRADATVSFATRDLQVDFGYDVSLFNNEQPTLRAENPYTEGYQGFQQYQLPPDNTAHQIKLAAGYNVSPTTRVMANFAYGVHLQDEPFLPYTVNPAITINTPLPRTSLDGEVWTTLAQLAVTTQPIPRLDVRASYRFMDRDNETPRDLYQYILADIATNSAALTDSTDRYNMPYSFQQHIAKIDGSYPVAPRTRLTLGYEFEQMDRTFSEATTNRTHTGRGKVRTQITDQLSGTVGYARSHRTDDGYEGNHTLFWGHTVDYINASAPNRIMNHPYLRKFYEANRVRDNATASLNYIANQRVSFGLSGSFINDDYDAILGLDNVQAWSITADTNYVPMEGVNLNAFYTYDRRKSEQTGHELTGLNNTANPIFQPGRLWWADIVDASHTVGVGADWEVVKNVFKLGVDYTFSDVKTTTDIETGADISDTDLPALRSKMHAISVFGDYSFAQNMALRVGYAFEHLRSSDWAIDPYTPTTGNASTIMLGDKAPDHNVHVVATSLKVKF